MDHEWVLTRSSGAHSDAARTTYTRRDAIAPGTCPLALSLFPDGHSRLAPRFPRGARGAPRRLPRRGRAQGAARAGLLEGPPRRPLPPPRRPGRGPSARRFRRRPDATPPAARGQDGGRRRWCRRWERRGWRWCERCLRCQRRRREFHGKSVHEGCSCAVDCS